MGNLVQGFPFCFLGGNYMKINKPWEKLITIGIIIIIAAGMWFLSIPCPFLWLFKTPCLGCGMSRAYASLLRLDFAAAFHFHPMFWAVPILVLLYLFDGKLFKKKWLNTALVVAVLSAFFICWIVRLCLGGI